jgi:hypothetical protein
MDGLVVRHGTRYVGMARQGFDLQLTRYDERGRRAPFNVTRATRADTDN